MSNMRKRKQAIVCTTATGCVEGDMLGQVLIWIETKNRPTSQRSHRGKTVKLSTKSKLRVVVKRTWRYSNEILRRVCALPGKGYRMVRRGISSMRKNKRNGH